MPNQNPDYNPFDRKDGGGRMLQLFDDEMNGTIEEVNKVRVA